MGLYDYTIYSAMKRSSRLYRDRTALICGSERISYGQFVERVERVAAGLTLAGINKGDRIGLLANNSPDFVVLCGAAAKIGAALVPINWRLRSEEISYIITEGSPKMVFFGHEFQPLLDPLVSKFDFVEEFYTVGDGKGDFKTLDDLTESNEMCPDEDVCSQDPYLIIYTAAVEGKPRGAILSHQGILASNMQSMYYFRLSNVDVHLVILPLFHLAGLGMALSIIQVGGLNILLPRFDVDLALQHIAEDKVTVFAEFSPMLKNLLDKAQEDKYDLSSLRIVCGFDDLETVRRCEKITGARFWSAYGQTETSGMVTYVPYSEMPDSAGFPGFLARIEIMDEYGDIVQTGKTGEIIVRGPLVFKGYWNLEKETENCFRDSWHHTGDVGRFDEKGYLCYCGRSSAKELIKTGGENVYPAEVEKTLLEHPLVQDVAVIGVPDPDWGEAIKAICVLEEGRSLFGAELIEFVGSRIARFKRPKHVVFVSDLPKREDGSTDRDKVRAYYGEI